MDAEQRQEVDEVLSIGAPVNHAQRARDLAEMELAGVGEVIHVE